ncbi:enoyl-CoA hydratase/isomerase family protein [Gordonia sp. (in: high G+C Gram-positive bacteria)]|uniref:enoyl-CoA hydratase/isomerase family protein n=1 Tax=Gordonia sp. (in: high G+C Gram-positive bacteria) TaxID=84139 RepID=UPI003529905D
MTSPTVASEPVLVRVDGGLAELTLNRPASLNALDRAMVDAMTDRLDDWRHDDAIRAVLVSGAGDRALCAGGDIVAIHTDALAAAGAGDAAAAASDSAGFWRDEYRLNAAIAEYPKPYVAFMDGFVMGGGVGISAHASVRIVTDRTRFAMPEVGIGLVPDVGGTLLLSRIPGELGTYIALTAVQLDGADVIAAGLADHYVPADRLDDLRAALATAPVDDAVARFAVEPPPSALAAAREWIAGAFAADSVTEIVERCRALQTPEASKTADRIEGKSPTSVAVALATLRAARADDSLRDALRREYRTSLRCLQHHDLAEGIRAQVIDKDRSPAWRPAREPSATEVAAFLAPLAPDLELTFTDEEHTP